MVLAFAGGFILLKVIFCFYFPLKIKRNSPGMDMPVSLSGKSYVTNTFEYYCTRL